MCMNCTCILQIIKTVNIYLFKVRASPKGLSFHCEKVEQFMHANKKRKAKLPKTMEHKTNSVKIYN